MIPRSGDRSWCISAAPFAMSPIATQDAIQARDSVLARAGALLPARDTVDRRIVSNVRSGTGRIIDSQGAVGGYPVYAAGTPPADGDHDGMPDAWEEEHGFDKNDATDGAGDADGDGYTNVEEYLNGTNPGAATGVRPALQRLPVRGSTAVRRARAYAFNGARTHRPERLDGPSGMSVVFVHRPLSPAQLVIIPGR